jgi:hypothetical protein
MTPILKSVELPSQVTKIKRITKPVEPYEIETDEEELLVPTPVRSRTLRSSTSLISNAPLTTVEELFRLYVFGSLDVKPNASGLLHISLVRDVIRLHSIAKELVAKLGLPDEIIWCPSTSIKEAFPVANSLDVVKKNLTNWLNLTVEKSKFSGNFHRATNVVAVATDNEKSRELTYIIHSIVRTLAEHLINTNEYTAAKTTFPRDHASIINVNPDSDNWQITSNWLNSIIYDAPKNIKSLITTLLSEGVYPFASNPNDDRLVLVLL